MANTYISFERSNEKILFKKPNPMDIPVVGDYITIRQHEKSVICGKVKHIYREYYPDLQESTIVVMIDDCELVEVLTGKKKEYWETFTE